MHRLVILVTVFAFVGTSSAAAFGEEADDEQFKTMSGMSVLGNNEAPKSLVIVPWKSSQIGDGIGVVDSLSNRPLPVDRDVFGRELRYYELRTSGDNKTTDSGQSLAVGSR
jgi:hypothetical protein